MGGMKIPLRLAIGAVAALMLQPACAATIYSGLLNTTIPNDFDGVTINIAGGTANFFFGGVGVANNSLLQPFRDGTANTDTLLNFSVGTVLGTSTTFLSTGTGGSQDHVGTGLGNTFAPGTEGYIGFKLNGANYGWMRVLLTDNTGGAKILEWAYDDSAANVSVGGIRQTGQDILLTMTFTLATQLANAGGTTNLIKSGSGTTTTLTGNNTQTGTTTITSGTLALASGASLSGTSSVTVQSTGILSGLGSIAGPTTIQGGATHSPGLTVGLQTFTNNLTYNSNAILTWDLAANAESGRGTSYDGVNVDGTLNIGNTVTANLVFNGAGSTVNWNNAFWDSNHSWLVYDNVSTPTLGSGSIFTTTTASNDSLGQSFALTGGAFAWNLSGNDIYLIYSIPEPCTALLGCLGLLLILRRRR